MGETKVTEEMNVHELWYKEARDITPETLAAFVEKLTKNYTHDYETICHAASAAAIAAAWAVDKSDQGGITGFQAGAIMWGFVKQWNYSHNTTGLKIVDYDNFLYPQYEDRYDKVLSPEIYASIQRQAQIKMDEADIEYSKYLENKRQYKKDMAAFVAKYPDYHERKKHYDRIGMGTGAEWEAQRDKEDAGFEFAPTKPYKPISRADDLYKYWLSIVNGFVPFGYRISEDA